MDWDGRLWWRSEGVFTRRRGDAETFREHLLRASASPRDLFNLIGSLTDGR
jgi:hypothetical protein